jgi:hypothetical protein
MLAIRHEFPLFPPPSRDMPTSRHQSKTDRATFSVAKLSPRWWEKRREDVIRLSARDFAKKHHCAIADIEAHQDFFFQTKKAASPADFKPKEWWEEHLSELEFLSVEAFATQYRVPVDSVEAAKTSLSAVETWNAQRRESEGKSANLRWLEDNHLRLDEVSREAWKRMNPDLAKHSEQRKKRKDSAKTDISYPWQSKVDSKWVFFDWWKKNLREPAELSPNQFCKKYGVELQMLEVRFNYFKTLGKSKMYTAARILQGIAQSKNATVMLKHKDELETTDGKLFIKKYQIHPASFYRLRNSFLEIGFIKVFPRGALRREEKNDTES